MENQYSQSPVTDINSILKNLEADILEQRKFRKTMLALIKGEELVPDLESDFDSNIVVNEGGENGVGREPDQPLNELRKSDLIDLKDEEENDGVQCTLFVSGMELIVDSDMVECGDILDPNGCSDGGVEHNLGGGGVNIFDSDMVTNLGEIVAGASGSEVRSRNSSLIKKAQDTEADTIDFTAINMKKMLSEEENPDVDYHGVEMKPKLPIELEKSTAPTTVCKQVSQLNFFIGEYKESDFWSAYKLFDESLWLKLSSQLEQTEFFGVLHVVWVLKHRKPPDYMNSFLLDNSYMHLEKSITYPPPDYYPHSNDYSHHSDQTRIWQLLMTVEVPFVWVRNGIEYHIFTVDGFSLVVGQIYERVYKSLILAVDIIDNIVVHNLNTKQPHHIGIQFLNTLERSFPYVAKENYMQKRGKRSREQSGSIKLEKTVRMLWMIPWRVGTIKIAAISFLGEGNDDSKNGNTDYCQFEEIRVRDLPPRKPPDHQIGASLDSFGSKS